MLDKGKELSKNGILPKNPKTYLDCWIDPTIERYAQILKNLDKLDWNRALDINIYTIQI